jgi:hypothetical protein
MNGVFRSVVGVFVFVLLLPHSARAQTIYLTGQNVQAVYEGWEPNADGTFTMIFGYLNRNYQEEPIIPVGPNNSFSPGPEDRGQPTHFYPRRQSFLFRVVVPADWGDKKLIWTVNANGKPTTAVGKLMPVWQINEGVWNATRLGSVNGETPGGNAPPTIKAVGSATLSATVATPVLLSVDVSDDGKPGPTKRRPQPLSQNTNGAFKTGAESPIITTTGLPARTIGHNNPYLPRDIVNFEDAHATGLAVTFMHDRGPGTTTFEPMTVQVKSEGPGPALKGSAKTTVRFSEPGTYVVKAVVDEGIQTRYVDFTINVEGNTAK